MANDSQGNKKKTDGLNSEQAVYLMEGWFPVNGKLLRKVQDQLNKGLYSDSTKIVDDIKTDFSLFTSCLRYMQAFAPSGDRHKAVNPIQFLNNASIEDFKNILSATEGSISSHSINDMVKDQALCLKNALISSTTAEILGEKVGLDSGMSFSCALVRQLGFNLVAWNYPKIYSRALSQMSNEGANLEKTLFKVLGFNPRSMGIRLVFPGHMSGSLLVALGEKQYEKESLDAPISEEAIQAAKFCELGEAFAKISDPEHFALSSNDWNNIVNEITHYLGPDGITRIMSEVSEQFANYASIAPRVFEANLSPEKNVRLSNLYHGKRLLSANSFVQKCSEALRTKFQFVYSAMVPGGLSIQALEILLSEVVPWAGFARGCVYLVDANSMCLIPRLKIGSGSLERYKPIRCDTDVLTDSPIVSAMFSSFPMKQHDVILNGERVSHISGSVGRGNRTGVLYLEIAEDVSDTLSNEQLILFRAIQQAINDCLGI